MCAQALTAEALAARRTALEVAARLQMEGASRAPAPATAPSIPAPSMDPVLAAAIEAAQRTASQIHRQVASQLIAESCSRTRVYSQSICILHLHDDILYFQGKKSLNHCLHCNWLI